MKMLRCFLIASSLIISNKAFAQLAEVYPPVTELREKLQRLVSARHTAFRDIKGGLRYKKGTVEYYTSTLHIVPNDTPKIAEDTNPIQVYYMDFVCKGLEEARSKIVFQKWKELMAAALVGYSIGQDGKQYPDLESEAFTAPDGVTKFTLYRNCSGSACQVSIVLVNSTLNELMAVYGTSANAAKPAPPVTSTSAKQLPSAQSKPTPNPAKEPSAEEKVMQQTLQKLLADRSNNFQSFRGSTVTSGKYTVKGTDYPQAEDLVEYIEVSQAKGTSYYVNTNGDWQSEALMSAFQHALPAAMKAQGYSYTSVSESGNTKSIAITYKGSTIASCVFKDADDESETTVTISGK